MSSSKYGFVYIWYDTKHKRFYIGCHWGCINDGYVCSSNWMRDSYRRRPKDFRRRILKTNLTREQMYTEENRFLKMIKREEISPQTKTPRYYNLCLDSKNLWHKDENKRTEVGNKISNAKRGKKIGPCTPEKAKAISEAKKKKFAEHGGFTPEHREKLRQAKLGKKLSHEHRSKVIKTLKHYKG